jgi:hypothetical protein
MKARKPKKSLRKGKKLEATKPLRDFSFTKNVDKSSAKLFLS